MEKVMEISTATIAFGTILGMAGAIGNFLIQLGLSNKSTSFIAITYILVTLLFISWLKEKLK